MTPLKAFLVSSGAFVAVFIYAWAFTSFAHAHPQHDHHCHITSERCQ